MTESDTYVDDGEELQSMLFYQASDILWTFCPPVIILFGTFGNVMTIVIIKRMSDGQSSNAMSLYFTTLAVSDLFILYAGLSRKWFFYTFDFDFRVFQPALCKIQLFLVYSCGMVSSWLLVSMTMQRVMSVVWPHYKRLSCSQRNVGTVIAVIVILVTSVNCYMLYLYSIVPQLNSTEVTCSSIDNEQLQYFDEYVYPYIDLIVTSLVPFGVLIIGNSVLVWKVIQSVQVARVMTAGGGDQVNSRQKKASSLTVTLITVSLTFLLLTMPICACSILSPFFNQGSDISKMNFAFTVCNLLWYASSAVNFYLYVLSGTRFRNEFKRLFFGRSAREITSTTKTSVISISDTTSGRHRDDEYEQTKSDF